MDLRDAHPSLPADLNAVLRLRDESPEELKDVLYEMGYRWIEPGYTPILLDPASYMSEAQRADPSIAAGIRATDAVFAHIQFLVEDEDDNLYGYWFGPERVNLLDAPIVKYDNEGQFSLLQGRGLVEALIGDRVFDDHEAFAEHAERFNELGIEIAARRWHDLADPQAATAPEELSMSLMKQFDAT
ncbi:MAG: hypothetical protein ACREP7_12450 [Lysobacter sp.]